MMPDINALSGEDSNMYQDVLKFWFEDTKPAQWWKKDEEFDRIIVERFSELHRRAARCEVFAREKG